MPGPSAPVAALTLSGLPNDRFLFAGFLPPKDKARGEVLDELAGVRATLVFYETAPRLAKSLAAIGEVLPGREVAVARELTKLYEECRTGSADELAAHYAAHPPKGEIVLLVGPPAEEAASAEDADALLREALATQKPSQAAAAVARATGLDRKALYARALELQAMKPPAAPNVADARARASPHCGCACKGWRILARRVKTPRGEVDLIARRGRTVAFVEVKWRATAASSIGRSTNTACAGSPPRPRRWRIAICRMAISAYRRAAACAAPLAAPHRQRLAAVCHASRLRSSER